MYLRQEELGGDNMGFKLHPVADTDFLKKVAQTIYQNCRSWSRYLIYIWLHTEYLIYILYSISNRNYISLLYPAQPPMKLYLLYALLCWSTSSKNTAGWAIGPCVWSWTSLNFLYFCYLFLSCAYLLVSLTFAPTLWLFYFLSLKMYHCPSWFSNMEVAHCMGHTGGILILALLNPATTHRTQPYIDILTVLHKLHT